jgi:Protein of unknown function (DUF2971)
MTGPPDKIIGCNAVNDHISKPVPNILWHYTSHAAFQGIISSKKIWATEYRFLNDRQEFLHAKQLAQNLVDEEPEYIGERFPARDYVRKAVNIVFNTGYLHEERLRVMVASFSEERDQLSQWRGYASDSRGVCIGFDLRHLRPPSDIGTAVTFAPCLYKRAEKCALLKAAFTHYRNGLQQWWDSVVDIAQKKLREGSVVDSQFGPRLVSEHREQLKTVLDRSHATLQFDLLRAAPLLKHESFSEEKEWRLVLPWRPAGGLPTVHQLEFRPTRDTLVPYIAYPLNTPGQGGPITCKDLVLGPGSHPSAEVGVNLFLQKEEVVVLAQRSQIPYRPV